MKGSFEFAFLMVFSMPFLVLGINFIDILMQYNHARYLKEYAVSAIEHQNRYDSSVEELITAVEEQYPNLALEIREVGERYQVKVSFPLRLPLIDYETMGEVASYTMLVD